jgi:hypothetical protein
MAASNTTSEAVWLREFVIDLGMFPRMGDPMNIFCDYTAAIANTKEIRSHSVFKHILHHYHIIREYVKDGKVKVCKVHTIGI